MSDNEELGDGSGDENAPDVHPVKSVTVEHRKRVEMLKDLRNENGPRGVDGTPDNTSDDALNLLNYKDFPALQCARATLAVKSKDLKLGVIIQSRITAMVGTLNLYMDAELSYTWWQAFLIAAKFMGLGVTNGLKRSCSIRTWIHQFLAMGKLSIHRHGQYHSSILDDEDLAQDIQLHLMEIAKNGYIQAQDVVDYVATPEIQEKLGTKARGISLRTGQRWLKKLNWWYNQKRNGMYIDGHE
jgi:hypothetical protein